MEYFGVAGCLSGMNEVFPVNTLLERELQSLWRFSLRLTGGEESAGSLVAATSQRVNEQRNRFTCHQTFRSSVFRMLYRIWCDQKRSSAFKLRLADRSDQVVGLNCCDGYGRYLCESVNRLPEAQRLIILLVCIEEFSYHEVADILDLPVKTVMSRLLRARLCLGKLQLNENMSACSAAIDVRYAQ